MRRQEERAVRRAFWMRHLRECSMAGERLSSYARRHELKVGEGYRTTLGATLDALLSQPQADPSRGLAFL